MRHAFQMSALLESSVLAYKAPINSGTCGFFRRVDRWHDMEHTQICRARLRCWNEVINCIRYQCTLDWYFNRYIVDDDDDEKDSDNSLQGKYTEYLILKVYSRTGPGVAAFNKESFMAGLNQQIEQSKLLKHIKAYKIN